MTRKAKKQGSGYQKIEFDDLNSSNSVKAVRHDVVYEDKKREADTLCYALEPEGQEDKQIATLSNRIEAPVFLIEGELKGQPTKELHFYFLCDKSLPMFLKMQVFASRFKSELHMQEWLGSVLHYLTCHLPQRYLKTARLVIDEAMVFASEAHEVVSIDKKDLVETHANLEKRTMRKALQMRGPGRPPEVGQFLEDVKEACRRLDAKHHLRKRGKKPKQVDVADILGCDPRNIRERQRTYTIKNWDETLRLCGWLEEGN